MKYVLAFLALTVAVMISGDAAAYIGPGAGISAIGTLIAFLAAVGLAIVGFVWYPIKRMRKRAKAAREEASK